MPIAIARFLIGVLVFVCSSGGIALAASNDEQAKAFIRDGLEFSAKQTSRLTDLAQRFDKVDMNGVLTVENVTSPTGSATGKATVAQFRALLAERRWLVSAIMTDSERFFASAPTADIGARALATWRATKAANIQMYDALDVVQTAWADSTDAVLEWTGKHYPPTLSDGHLMFASDAQKSEFFALLQTVNVRVAKMMEIMQATAIAQAAAVAKREAYMADISKALAK